MNWVITYDIESDRARARVAAVLSAFGDRVQKSVFECMLDEDEVRELIERTDRLISHASDSIILYRQCADCTDAKTLLGQAESPSSEPFWIV